jgi:Uma2 family endonuclease
MTEVAADRWRWTVQSYEQAAAAGVFGPEPRVELIAGEVFTVAPMRPGHAAVLRQVHDLLAESLDRTRRVIGSQLPLRLDDNSEPEPDVWVAYGSPVRYRTRHPAAADVALVVEVADTSLLFDRQVKIPKYATAAIPETWLFALPEQAVYRFADPHAGEYQVTEQAGRGSRIRCRALDLEIAVDTILV